MKPNRVFDLLLSLPSNMCGQLADCEPQAASRCFATFDPPRRQLGSGGGTAYVLEQAWRSSGEHSFSQWLERSGKIVLHGGGESRRLPSYAAPGKLFIPIPVFRWALGQRLDQTLLDLAEPTLRRLAQAAPPCTRAMVASGDVLVRLPSRLPCVPEADVVLFGLWAKPEDAQNFGVMFCDPEHPERLDTFLQKPSPDVIREKSREHAFLVDVGIWLLSDRAVDCLMQKCGWNAGRQAFAAGSPETYDLYGSWAFGLGQAPVAEDPRIGDLSVAVVPLSGAGFHHFGTSADLLQSLYELQNLEADQSKLGAVPSLAQPRQFVQNSVFNAPLRREENHSLWVENSHIADGWKIASRNILTGVPDNEWVLALEDGVCLDFLPVGGKTALRAYGYSDVFRGAVADPATRWIGRPVMQWMEKRGIAWAEAGIDPRADLQAAPLFPALEGAFDPGFVQWMFAAVPKGSGLGTSSILAATLLGVLSDLAGLGWDTVEVVQRTLALEQMLTSGGGWQDQVGGVFPGIKLVRTAPGLGQEPEIRWLPGRFFQGAQKNRMLLYYTGITRVAHDILGEIVRGIFLNSRSRLDAVGAIAANAESCHDAIQRGDFDTFVEAIRTSWELNNQLDPGTTTPGVRRILDLADEGLAAAKLLGAGGGGYLFMVAEDADAALRIRRRLESEPPNSGARFVDFALSEAGLQITRS